LTTWSPLASGLLTGKYQGGIPDDSRGAKVEWLQEYLTDPEKLAKVDEFLAVADDVGCTPGQLALAWTASNPNVSSVIIGARRIDQLNENLGALDVMASLTDDHKSRIDEIFS
ncbi:MAG: aldo/keto reductase, partial [Acidimicrobiia bacterium]|nr:aldo/keto reductase [Acidimicrobiia bacterium]